MNQFFFVGKDEKPLDRMVSDGGFCTIFRTICCIGDSLSSGEFETRDKEGNIFYHDFFEYSWGQYIARMTGSKVYNFSRGGMTAKEYCETFAHTMGYWAPSKAAQAYIIALGVNDIYQDIELGRAGDENKGTFASYYLNIIRRYRELSRGSVFFLVTMAKEESDTEEVTKKKLLHREILYQCSKLLDQVYVIDLYQYAPVYDREFKENFYLYGHMNAAGYYVTAKMIASYIDYIIRSHFEKFKEVGLIGSGIVTF